MKEKRGKAGLKDEETGSVKKKKEKVSERARDIHVHKHTLTYPSITFSRVVPFGYSFSLIVQGYLRLTKDSQETDVDSYV